MIPRTLFDDEPSRRIARYHPTGVLPVRTTTPLLPTTAWLRERAVAAETRDRRKQRLTHALVWLSIVGNFGWPIVLFHVLN